MGYDPRCLQKSDLPAYLRSIDPAGHDRGFTLHHTWSPTTADWRGRQSMLNAYSYFRNTREPPWSHLPCQAWCAADGIWLARPFAYTNGAHAYVNKDWSNVDPDCRAWCNGNRQALNYYTTSCETVGNFDSEDPVSSGAMRNAVAWAAASAEVFGFPVERIWFHRMVEWKTCPGSRVVLAWFRGEVVKALGGQASDVVRVYDATGVEIDCDGKLVDGRTVVQIAPLLEALGFSWTWNADPREVRIEERA